MDNKQACHAIALDAAKAYVTANMPEYVNAGGIEAYAKDMAQQYIIAYKTAEAVFLDPKNVSKAKIR